MRFSKILNGVFKHAKHLVWPVVVVGCISIVRSTAAQGTDFNVFWRSALLTLKGEPLYSIARDGGMVFKYPPWILPFFLPFGLLSVETAKWIWGGIEVLSLGYIVGWLCRTFQVSRGAWFLTLCLFWGLWIVHALDGQVSLVMLALALGCWSARPDFSRQGSVKLTVLALALSAKIFTVFPLFSLKLSRRVWLQALGIAGVVGLLSLPAIRNEPNQSAVSLVKSWAEAAGSAGNFFEASRVRGRRNPGLPGYALRLLDVPAQNSQADVGVALILAVVFGLIWRSASRGLAPEAKWIGWLALVPVIHPLPWLHLFVFTFPLAVFVVDRSLAHGAGRGVRLYCIAGVFLICFSSEKVLGPVGLFMEFNAAKSWGALSCLTALVLHERRQV